MNVNGNRPDPTGENPLDQAEDTTIEWLDGYREGHLEGYVIGFDQGLGRGRSEGYDEAAYRFRILIAEYHDSDLQEAFERMMG